MVAPFDQVLFVGLEEVNITFPPEQKDVGPLAEMVGSAGYAKTVNVKLAEVEEHVPFETLT